MSKFTFVYNILPHWIIYVQERKRHNLMWSISYIYESDNNVLNYVCYVDIAWKWIRIDGTNFDTLLDQTAHLKFILPMFNMTEYYLVSVQLFVKVNYLVLNQKHMKKDLVGGC
ncbi:hypothetical protein WA026_008288 [Henosepilachna vigintioctopunctata]|uniref:Uncharacterized protein n=1 Tax=Henosepilachna vigintioctopunctata TaxID=420089 RepID=A0AAW1TIV2_9CUCU